jgi:hypothetical protein
MKGTRAGTARTDVLCVLFHTSSIPAETGRTPVIRRQFPASVITVKASQSDKMCGDDDAPGGTRTSSI